MIACEMPIEEPIEYTIETTVLNKKLIGQDSIHTIKEDDFSKEEDETLYEDHSRDLRLSPQNNSPTYLMPHSQLDIPLGMKSPRAQQYLVRSRISDEDQQEDSPLKLRTLEYNSKTIKE